MLKPLWVGVVSLKTQLFWDMTLCQMVHNYERFSEVFWFHLQGQTTPDLP